MTWTPGLYGELFEDRAIADIFSDTATLQGMLDFEAALARAEAEEGIIPLTAVGPIVAACRAGLYDIAEIGRQTTLAGNPAIPMVKLLTAKVAGQDREAARWVHWGATSQDAIDSGRAAQMIKALELVADRLIALCAALGKQVEAHRHTVMPGRTLLQHALPTTFGLKLAYWLDAVLSHYRALKSLTLPSPVPLGGAAGTLASLGPAGARLQERLGGTDAVPFHATRQGFVRIGCELGLLAGTLGKIARDIMLLMQTEVAEVFEPAEAGKGGSSALPHKRNPVQSLAMAAIAGRTPGLVATLLSAMVQEHERATGGWHAEWQALPELFILTGAALNHAVPLITGMDVDAARMRTNLDLTQGLILSERVALALGEKIGRMEAKAIIEAASKQAIAGRVHLKVVLQENATVCAHLSPGQIDQLLDPATYLGASDRVIDRVLERLHIT